MTEPTSLVRWALFLRPDEPNIIVLVVDDAGDDGLVSVIAEAGIVPSPRFGGVWGSGQEDGHWLVSFQLIELGAGPAGFGRVWYTAYFDRQLLEAILDVPHYVAILPQEFAGDAKTGQDMAPRLGGSLIVEVEHRSPLVEQVLAERRD